jgi:acetyl/propionyl-CoA carboxylase alpha subunit
VTRELRWANARYEEILNGAKQAEERALKPGKGRPLSRKSLLPEFDRRGMEDYIAFLQRRDADRRERRAQEAFALREREEAQKRKDQEQKKKEIGDAAVQEYKSQKKEEEEKAEQKRKESKDNVQRLLTNAGVEEDKIGLVLKEMALNATTQDVFRERSLPLLHAQLEANPRHTPVATGNKRSILSRLFLLPPSSTHNRSDKQQDIPNQAWNFQRAKSNPHVSRTSQISDHSRTNGRKTYHLTSMGNKSSLQLHLRSSNLGEIALTDACSPGKL